MSADGIAVQITSSLVLPWIGGPSWFSSPGWTRHHLTEYRTTQATITKIGIETISRTSHSVSIGPAWVDACVGNQWISRPAAMPTADAITPTTIASAMLRLPRLTAAHPTDSPRRTTL